ncbi:heat shock protein HslJ [Microbacterium resistens]|uniref:Heat shock protein HslJ n=1 Tax=Microbacterium resistens TaxID=156977 RepID=A0ABU1SAR7_9MICO|nr:META domain-containing protein [Microbacterium resistens]MDR6866702.1 heat shock protein HslJ [Microbacterium resistens]
MKTSALVLLGALAATALTACAAARPAGPSEAPEPSATGSAASSPAPGSTPGSTSSGSGGLGLDATWQSTQPGTPFLSFRADGSFNGSDGCNDLVGTYTREGDLLTLAPGLTTLKGCVGVDSWLRAADTATITDGGLQVFNAEGAAIGVLAPR